MQPPCPLCFFTLLQPWLRRPKVHLQHFCGEAGRAGLPERGGYSLSVTGSWGSTALGLVPLSLPHMAVAAMVVLASLACQCPWGQPGVSYVVGGRLHPPAWCCPHPAAVTISAPPFRYNSAQLFSPLAPRSYLVLQTPSLPSREEASQVDRCLLGGGGMLALPTS